MFKKVLFPTDYSDASKKALEYVKKLKEAGTEEVILLYVLDTAELHAFRNYAMNYGDVYDKIIETSTRTAKEELDAIAKELRQSGLTVQIMITKGIPFEEILKVEKEQDVSMVVIGSHGKSAMKGVMMGSVSNRVIRRSTKPVLVVRWDME